MNNLLSKKLIVSFASAALSLGVISPAIAAPKVILLSLDGMTPWLLNQYFADGSIAPNNGLGLLKNVGYSALQNITCNPTLTAACHITIGTGSNTNNTDIPQNSYHLVKSPFTSNISGFGGPIGGYETNPIGVSFDPTAIPIWQPLRAAGKTVVAATFPGADGVNVVLPGGTGTLLQPGTDRTVDYTVPFGSSQALGSPSTGNAFAQGYALNGGNFTDATATVLSQLTNAGISFTGSVKVANLNSFKVGANSFNIQVAAIATQTANVFDNLVIFDANQGIISLGSPALPATGSAVINPVTQFSNRFYLGPDNSGNQVGTTFYSTRLDPNLSTVHVASAAATFIPSNPNVVSNVNDINNNVGFWSSDPDFRIPQRSAPGFNDFSLDEVSRIYQDQSKNFIDYQTNVLLRAIDQNPNADLVLGYNDQPDASSHQYLLVDPRQPTNPQNPNSIGAGQDPAIVALYQGFVKDAYLKANDAVQRIIDKVGLDSNGKPNSNIIVVSDHGFEPFYTAVNLNAYLTAQGFNSSQVRAVTSGAATQIYINLQGREPNGNVTPTQYLTLQQQIVTALQNFVDTNPLYTLGKPSVSIFDKIYTRPANLGDPNFGLETDNVIGQDFGDVFATLTVGYNFDGTQSPVVTRQGDTSAQFLSVPSFYGAHGYDPTIPNLSAIFLAAGPDIGQGTLPVINNIDIAPTISNILGVPSANTVQGTPLNIGVLVPEPSNTQGILIVFGVLGLGIVKPFKRLTKN
jgi:predicted AlkP superfamily pyrophosphatase or phosphodiesterase